MRAAQTEPRPAIPRYRGRNGPDWALCKAMTEADLQSSVKQLAELRGWLHFHVFDSRRCEPGWPDSVMLRGPRIVVAELKREGRKPEPTQRLWLDAFEEAGAEAYHWQPSDWFSRRIDEVLA